jgi:hypothetical protein
MDFRETARVYALPLRIRKLRSKMRHWLHGIFSKRLLNGQFYKLYENLRNYREKFFSYFRMSTKNLDKSLVAWWTTKCLQKHSTTAVCATIRETSSCIQVPYRVSHITFFKTYIQNTIYGICVENTKEYKQKACIVEPSDRVTLFLSSSCVAADRTSTKIW